jgi:hypothetical protein
VAFKKLARCDSSDMVRWASSIPTDVFVEEILEMREKSLRALIKKPSEDSAAEVRAIDRIVSLIEEARNMR